jgi:hypothetical protein
VQPDAQRPGRAAAARRIALSAVGGALVLAALLAIAILLFGEFGGTVGRILATTFMLAAFGLLALPAAILVDQGRRPRLAAGGIALPAAGFALATATVWSGEPPEVVAKLMGTTVALAVATAQTAALAARRRESDPALVRRLFAASTALVAGLAAVLAVVIWVELDSELFGRLFGAGVVLDALLVALQPLVALRRGVRPAPRAGPAPRAPSRAFDELAASLTELAAELEELEGRLGEARALVAEQRAALDELRAGLGPAPAEAAARLPERLVDGVGR